MRRGDAGGGSAAAQPLALLAQSEAWGRFHNRKIRALSPLIAGISPYISAKIAKNLRFDSPNHHAARLWLACATPAMSLPRAQHSAILLARARARARPLPRPARGKAHGMSRAGTPRMSTRSSQSCLRTTSTRGWRTRYCHALHRGAERRGRLPQEWGALATARTRTWHCCRRRRDMHLHEQRKMHSPHVARPSHE